MNEQSPDLTKRDVKASHFRETRSGKPPGPIDLEGKKEALQSAIQHTRQRGGLVIVEAGTQNRPSFTSVAEDTHILVGPHDSAARSLATERGYKPKGQIFILNDEVQSLEFYGISPAQPPDVILVTCPRPADIADFMPQLAAISSPKITIMITLDTISQDMKEYGDGDPNRGAKIAAREIMQLIPGSEDIGVHPGDELGVIASDEDRRIDRDIIANTNTDPAGPEGNYRVVIRPAQI